MRDFTLDMYRDLCQTIVHAGYKVTTVKGYLESLNPPLKLVVLRHDVDRSPGSALKMAELERELGLSATYYFRKRSHTFKPEVITTIAQMGHEIGYHYEALTKARGDYKKAIQIFRDELDEFRELCNVVTISMHGSPLSKYDNRDLWRQYDFRDFGVIGEAYLSIDYDKVVYLSDTGRTWSSRRYNIRDKIGKGHGVDIETTTDLISLLETKQIRQLCILSHPNRWSEGRMEYFKAEFCDFVFNQGKNLIALLRSGPDH